MSLYDQPAATSFHLGWVPSVHLLPGTIEGVQRLALEAVSVNELTVLDKLELHLIGLMKIEPEGLKIGEKAKAIRILHEPNGLAIKWLASEEGECPCCEGTTTLYVIGKDRCDYDVECPRCYGSGRAEDAEERFIVTDIDGNFIREAA